MSDQKAPGTNPLISTQRDKMTTRGLMVAIAIFLADTILTTQMFNISPILPVMMEELNMNLSLGNLSISLVYLFMAAGMFISPPILGKLGTKAACNIAIFMGAAGCAMNYIVINVFTLFISRILIGAGVGLIFATISAVIAGFFAPKYQPFLNGLYGGMPYVGNLIAIALTVPMFNGFNGSWRNALGIWSLVFILPFIVWMVFAYKKKEETDVDTGAVETNLFRKVWKYRNVKLMTLVYSMDMVVFGFSSGVIPTYLVMDYGETLERASQLTLAFPILGVICAFSFGGVITATGLRKPTLCIGQISKAIGMILICLPFSPLRVLGIGLLGAGSALWMPAFYTVIMDEKDFDAKTCAAAVALASAIPYIFGCVAPAIGGAVADAIGFKPTFIIWIVPALIGLTGALLTPETGKKRNKKAEAQAAASAGK
ncbi:MFS transporter [Ruminococcaceae bacterium OttesenSCG-928-I18]|nr:MFS transporter [Ruminococcaceae bacterium OttesenSCG-928-I18]